MTLTLVIWTCNKASSQDTHYCERLSNSIKGLKTNREKTITLTHLCYKSGENYKYINDLDLGNWDVRVWVTKHHLMIHTGVEDYQNRQGVKQI